MPRHNKDEKFVFDDGEDEDREDPVAIKVVDGEDEDDDEANEDLSLKILEKALSRRDVGNKLDSDLSDSGVVNTVMVNGGKSKVKKSESNKKMKRNKLEAAHEIPIVWRDQDEEKVEEEVVKGEGEDEVVERSDEPKTEETSSNLVLKKLLRGARYFDPPDAGWVSCYSCGHTSFNCPTPTKRRKPCFICGSLEHGAKQCSKGHDCYICKKGGHRAKDCPNKYKNGSKGAVCLRCGDFGHDMILCKYEYSQEDLKDIQCYVCKSFGHLCCVEPGNSPSWAVSCYRCGQLGHTGLACGRHYEERNENDSSSLNFPENNREASECYRCGEEGHFARECPNSSSISTSQGRESQSLCYRCNGAGHFARECPNSSQVSKRDRDTSTPSHKSRKKNKENSEHDSTPHESNGKAKKKKKKTHKEEQPQTSPRKRKHRGGWITEEPEEESFQRGKTRRPKSPITPSGYNKSPSTHMGHNYRSPKFNSGGHFPGSQSSRHHSGPSPSRWQPSYPPSHHHQHHHHHHHQHHHHQNQSYGTAPPRYGRAHHNGEFAGNYERW
ncbi:Zinc finger CCHC-type [Arabidopsis thaliana x Arabidopsis arenosa]|uniref:Zinc finger CCHC-type n=1 Tax=Arabidopsis thaliana x Arabidopsis arenosa TaxID=1240361 RepID=A0A8T1ZJR7_9BRAS|nr:Zinc finger CCHC-type [Arabidopsis thaliana x Arabidopsis arenosa]